jgi:hypothetical protein
MCTSRVIILNMSKFLYLIAGQESVKVIDRVGSQESIQVIEIHFSQPQYLF